MCPLSLKEDSKNSLIYLYSVHSNFSMWLHLATKEAGSRVTPVGRHLQVQPIVEDSIAIEERDNIFRRHFEFLLISWLFGDKH